MMLHHIAMIVSSEAGVDFYKALGFDEVDRQKRNNDQIVWLKGACCILELYVDATHPQRVTAPEANGLRYIGFETEHIEAMWGKLGKYNPEEIRREQRLFFVKDPDGQPIEIREFIPNPPVGDGYNFDDVM